MDILNITECLQFTENLPTWWLLASPVEMWDEVHIQDMVISCIIMLNMMVQEQLEGGEESTGDYFQEGSPQDHDNDDGNSNIAN